jgi:hypothetical protein
MVSVGHASDLFSKVHGSDVDRKNIALLHPSACVRRLSERPEYTRVFGRVICLIMALRLMDMPAASPYSSPGHVIPWSVFQSLLLAQHAVLP